MRHRAPLTGLATALLSLPLVAGCAALGIPAVPVTSEDALAAGASPEASLDPTQPTSFASPDGYTLTLPPGWASGPIAPIDAMLALDALATTEPDLGELARIILTTAGARVSMVAGDPLSLEASPVPLGVAVLVVPAKGADDDQRQAIVGDAVRSLPALGEGAVHTVVTVPAGDAHRYELQLATFTGVVVQLRMLQFSVGDNAVVLVCAAPADTWQTAAPTFEAIVKSLRFGL